MYMLIVIEMLFICKGQVAVCARSKRSVKDTCIELIARCRETGAFT